ncbi:carbohydrate kinase, partial [bacterium]|nr:carbohydrate kinase [bacterium]
LTGIAGVEPTYIGSHTYLWDFERGYWSDVADKLGITPYLPEKISRPWDVLGKIKPEIAEKTGINKNAIVTHGIHDSNAALLPYLITQEHDFVLNSTGTWCVVMHEQDKIHFNEDELGKVVFFNISTFSKPVKTSIFMGGAEFDQYNEILTKIHGDKNIPSMDLQLLREVIDEKSCFIIPGISKGTGQFPESSPRIIENGRSIPYEKVENGEIIPDFFRNKAKAYAVLNLSLAIQTKVSLDRSDMKDGIPLFTEGGFSRNDVYNALLTLFYPSSDIALTNLDEASAFGAAIIGKCAIENVNPNAFKEYFYIEKTPVKRISIPTIGSYYDAFMEYI